MEIASILRTRAKTFVIIGWIVFVVSIPVCFLISWSAGFSQFYFPEHPGVTLNAYDLKASKLVFASGAFATAASTIAFS